MERIFGHKLRVFFVCLSLILVSVLMINNSLYTHCHIDEYGQVIYHAHPFSGADDIPLPLKDSKHSNSHLYILSSILVLFVVSAFFIGLKDRGIDFINRIINEKLCCLHFTDISKPRGPPHFL